MPSTLAQAPVSGAKGANSGSKYGRFSRDNFGRFRDPALRQNTKKAGSCRCCEKRCWNGGMNQHTESNFIHFPTPSDPAEDPAGGDPKGYAPKIIDMMCEKIRRYGLSDSAAAEQVGMSSSTVSRWKQLYPEIAPQLQQARQDCRLRHLENIEKAAEAENGRGWRPRRGSSSGSSRWITRGRSATALRR